VLDIIVVILILLLSVKGYFNGFIRETVGLFGLIGGVFVASRAAASVGNYIDTFVHLDNPAMLKLFGFLLVLGIIWGGSSFVATVFAALKAEPHSKTAKVLGMGVAALKYLMIFAMITASLLNNQLVRNNFSSFVHSSKLFPFLNSTGSVLINTLPLPETKNIKQEKQQTNKQNTSKQG